jgi:seryl-tRNA synthetase
MLQVNILEETIDAVKVSLAKRNWSSEKIDLVQETINLNTERKAHQTSLDAEKAKLNQLSSEIGDLFKSGKKTEATQLKGQVSKLKLTTEEKEATLSQIEAKLASKCSSRKVRRR